MIPHAIEEGGSRAAFVVLLGYLLVHLTQHTLAPHFHFGEEKHAVTPAVGWSALAGLLLHTFIDGVAIASGFAVSSTLGILVFFAILLHKTVMDQDQSDQNTFSRTARRPIGSCIGRRTIAGRRRAERNNQLTRIFMRGWRSMASRLATASCRVSARQMLRDNAALIQPENFAEPYFDFRSALGIR